MTNIFVPKDVPEMPDSYGVEVTILGGKTEKYELVNHRPIDRLFDGEGRIIGVHPTPFWEFILKDNDEIMCVPISSAIIKFDSRWFKICMLRAKEVEKKKESKVSLVK